MESCSQNWRFTVPSHLNICDRSNISSSHLSEIRTSGFLVLNEIQQFKEKKKRTSSGREVCEHETLAAQLDIDPFYHFELFSMSLLLALVPL